MHRGASRWSRWATGLTARSITSPALFLLTGLAVVAAMGLAAARLSPVPTADQLTNPKGSVARATKSLDRTFGAEPITVAGTGDTQALLAPRALGQMLGLEGRLMALEGVQAVYGPGTFLNQVLLQMERTINRLGATRTRSAADQAAIEQQLMVRFGAVGVPSFGNRNFIKQLFLGTGTEPKAQMRWLLPTAQHALIIVRPKAGLTDAETRSFGAHIRRLTDKTNVSGVTFQVAGIPLLAAAVSDEIRVELLHLTPVAILIMIVVLLVGFRSGRRRLRTLLLAGVATVVTAGLTEIAGLGLSIATIAALPVVLGLALDYAVQVQARYWDERTFRAPKEAAVAAVHGVGPVLTVAAVSTCAGFLTLTLGNVPVLDRLGWTLVIGTATSLLVVLLLAPPLLIIGDKGKARAPVLPTVAVPARLGRALLMLAVPLTVAGIAVSGGTPLQSDIAKLVPHGLDELAAGQALQKELGVNGQLRIAVSGGDVTRPEVIAWMQQAQARVLAVVGRLQPGPNVAGILTGASAGKVPDAEGVRRLLGVIPGYLLDAVVSPDRSVAELSFGIPLISVQEQGELLGRIDAALADAPAGIRVEPAGLAAAAAESAIDLRDGRPWTLLIAVAVIGLLLLAVTRRPQRALVALLPALLAAGCSSVLLRVVDVKLSPLSAGLEPLVLAVGVEFGLLLEHGYLERRRSGMQPQQAARRTQREVGAAVAVSAATVAAGFLVLAASRIQVLGQFGLLVTVEVLLCAAGAILVIPTLCAVLDARAARAGPRSRRAAPQDRTAPRARVLNDQALASMRSE
jgi:hydrophobe/amphiphile efflux-3 (HAE3) family protein